LEVFGADPAVAPGDLLRAAHAQPLARLDGLDEVRGLDQRLVGAGVEPGVAAAELLQVQAALLEVAAVEIGDLELAAWRRLELRREVARPAIVEIQAGDRVVGP